MVANTDREKAELYMHQLWSRPGGIVDLVTTGKRDPAEVANILKAIKDGKQFKFAAKPAEEVSLDVRNQLSQKHLDIQNVTLCAASRDSDGNVPKVNWNQDNSKVNVNWYYSDNRNENLRSRLEVFCK